MHGDPMPLEHALEGVGQVADEMKPVSDVRGFRGTQRRSLDVAAGAVAADDLDAGMRLKPYTARELALLSGSRSTMRPLSRSQRRVP